jgi:putative serine protease PepD
MKTERARPKIGYRAPLLLSVAGLLLASACTGPVSLPFTEKSANPSPAARATQPTGQPANSASSGTSSSLPAAAGFDAVHAASIAAPAVAMIIVQTGRGTAEGSGVAFQKSDKGTDILTNNHVVSGSTSVQVLMPDGRHFPASVVGTDAHEDLAVIRVQAALSTAQFGDSTKLKVGQSVLAIGSPLGNQSSVTAGIVSALHRTLSNVGAGQAGQQESLPDVLQTDAPINPGNSGGPLVDGGGLVVGINTAGASAGSGIGFAIPSAVAQRVAVNLAAGKAPADPYVGVCTQPIEDALTSGKTVDGYGSLVAGVVSGGPASRAGIHTGDVIQSIDGVDLNNGMTLGGALQVHSAGDQVKFAIKRNGSLNDIGVQLAAQPSQPASC